MDLLMRPRVKKVRASVNKRDDRVDDADWMLVSGCWMPDADF